VGHGMGAEHEAARAIVQARVRMKTEQKYPEPNRIVFYILSDRIRIFVFDFTVFAFVFEM
jgi:hypothetical protein